MERSASPPIRYVEYGAPDDLAPWVEAIGVLTLPRQCPGRAWRLIGDGRGRASLPLAPDRSPVFRGGSLVPGDITTPPVGDAALVRFTPWVSRALATGWRGSGWWSGAAGVWAAIRGQRTADPCQAAAEWLRGVLPAAVPDPRAVAVWSMILRDPGVGVGQLSGALGLSPRTMHRVLHRAGAATVRTIRELERFRSLLRLLRRELRLSWTEAAMRAGYCDHSHLCRAFVRWTGLGPGRFFGEGHHHMNDVFARPASGLDRGRLRAVGAPVPRPATPPAVVLRDRRRWRGQRPAPFRGRRSG